MRRYSWQIDEVIWDRHCRGLTQAEIQGVLANDPVTIEEIGAPIEMPIRTISDKLKKLREEHGDPEGWIFPGKELEACNALQRDTLAWTNRQIRKILAVEEPSESDQKALTKLQLLSTRVANHLAAVPKDPQKQDAGRSRHSASIEELVAQIEAEEAKASPNGHTTHSEL